MVALREDFETLEERLVFTGRYVIQSDWWCRLLRERKDAILELFDVIGLKPEIESKAKGPDSFKRTSEASQKQDKKTVKEIVGDGEEVEVEAGQELSTNDIGLIYKK